MESVQWNFNVKVYEIDSFFYVFVDAQIELLVRYSSHDLNTDHLNQMVGNQMVQIIWITNHLNNELREVCYSDVSIIWIFAIQIPTVYLFSLHPSFIGVDYLIELLFLTNFLLHETSLHLHFESTLIHLLLLLSRRKYHYDAKTFSPFSNQPTNMSVIRVMTWIKYFMTWIIDTFEKRKKFANDPNTLLLHYSDPTY